MSEIESLLDEIATWLKAAGVHLERRPSRFDEAPAKLVFTPNRGSLPEAIYQIEAFPPLRDGGDWVLDLDALSIGQTIPILRRGDEWNLVVKAESDVRRYVDVPLTKESLINSIEEMTATLLGEAA